MKIAQETLTLDELCRLEPEVEAALAAGDAIFDCSKLKAADSALLALLMKWLESAHEKGLTPQIINMPEGMWSLAKLYGVREVIRPYCVKSAQ